MLVADLDIAPRQKIKQFSVLPDLGKFKIEPAMFWSDMGRKDVGSGAQMNDLSSDAVSRDDQSSGPLNA